MPAPRAGQMRTPVIDNDASGGGWRVPTSASLNDTLPQARMSNLSTLSLPGGAGAATGAASSSTVPASAPVAATTSTTAAQSADASTSNPNTNAPTSAPTGSFDCPFGPREFNTVEAAKEWLKSFSLQKGFASTTRKSWLIDRTPKVSMGCSRGGRPTNNHNVTDERRQRQRISGRCGCPFQADMVYQDAKWILSVVNAHHNHAPIEPGETVHFTHRRLTERELDVVRQYYMTDMDAQSVLDEIKEINPHTLALARDVRNAISKMRAEAVMAQQDAAPSGQRRRASSSRSDANGDDDNDDDGEETNVTRLPLSGSPDTVSSRASGSPPRARRRLDEQGASASASTSTDTATTRQVQTRAGPFSVLGDRTRRPRLRQPCSICHQHGHAIGTCPERREQRRAAQQAVFPAVQAASQAMLSRGAEVNPVSSVLGALEETHDTLDDEPTTGQSVLSSTPARGENASRPAINASSGSSSATSTDMTMQLVTRMMGIVETLERREDTRRLEDRDRRRAEDELRRAEEHRRRAEEDRRKALTELRKAERERRKAEEDRAKAEEDREAAEQRRNAEFRRKMEDLDRRLGGSSSTSHSQSQNAHHQSWQSGSGVYGSGGGNASQTASNAQTTSLPPAQYHFLSSNQY